MDIVLGVFLWIAPLTLILVLLGLVLRKFLGVLPQWLLAVALVLCLGIMAWCHVWISRQDGGLQTLPAMAAEVNAAVAAVVVAVAWVVRAVRSRRQAGQDREPDSANAARLR